MTELLYSSKAEIRFSEDGRSVYVWMPYNEKAIAEIKQTFNNKSYGDPGAEWDIVLKCWIVHTGWTGCEDWLDKLIELLNKHYPEIKA